MKRKTKKLLLNIGIIALLIGLVFEVWIENYISLIVLIPVMYLLDIKRTL